MRKAAARKKVSKKKPKKSGKTQRAAETDYPRYWAWRAKVMKRDKGVCVECGSKVKLEVDHIRSWQSYPRGRYAVNNGRLLCSECHDKKHPWRIERYGKR